MAGKLVARRAIQGGTARLTYQGVDADMAGRIMHWLLELRDGERVARRA